MPEGDTVYALARRLDAALRGRVLTHGELRVPAHATADLAGRTVLDHSTHGKHLLGVRLPVVELLRTRDEASAVGHLGPEPYPAAAGFPPSLVGSAVTRERGVEELEL